MTPKKQRIAIAEACGWTVILSGTGLITFLKQGIGGCTGSIKDTGVVADLAHIPNYLSDLNAMHEAEKMLSMKQLVQYGNLLNRMELKYNYGYVECVINATATQRAEAFLRTIGKWEE